MKQRDLIKKFTDAGFEFYRHGGNHDIYKRGEHEIQIPRHREINERLAQSLIRKWGLK
jgi:mRNA interferase HicA